MKPQPFIQDMIFMACCTSIRWSFKSIHCSFFRFLWHSSFPFVSYPESSLIPYLPEYSQPFWLICGQSLVSHWCTPMMQNNKGSEWRSLWLGLHTLSEGGCQNHPVCWRTRPQFKQKEGSGAMDFCPFLIKRHHKQVQTQILCTDFGDSQVLTLHQAYHGCFKQLQ